MVLGTSSKLSFYLLVANQVSQWICSFRINFLFDLSSSFLLSFNSLLTSFRRKHITRLGRRCAIKRTNSRYIVCHIHWLVSILLHWAAVFRWIKICLYMGESCPWWSHNSHQSFIVFWISSVRKYLELTHIRGFEVLS